jgi:hypothetical protein
MHFFKCSIISRQPSRASDLFDSAKPCVDFSKRLCGHSDAVGYDLA